MISRRRRPALVVGLAFLAVALVGCTGGATANRPGAEASAGAEAAGGDTPVATTSVDLPKSYRLDPVAITVSAGATVTWTNNDDFTHNVMFEGDEAQVMKPGEQTTRTFPEAGTFAYLCTLHPREMQGTVTVIDGA